MPAPQAGQMSEALIGIVAIGRNEGQRLVACLRSLAAYEQAAVVYVDSGSTDGSVERARELGADVVRLETDVPFTAARARNAGWRRLIEIDPKVRYVQFVDGDCEVAGDWPDAARRTLEGQPQVAVVCGRRREKHREASIYNRLCDMEWDTPVGEAAACGGDAMMRIDALQQVGGFDETIIAGEEPELCRRFREAGWRVLRIDAEMTLHDADMHRFGQWRKRMQRSGHAYAEAAARSWGKPTRSGVRECLSIACWAGVWPATAIVLAWPTRGLSLPVGGIAYVALMLKAARGRRGERPADRLLWGASCVVGKWPQWMGMIQYFTSRMLGRRPTIIEYKGAVKSTTTDPA